jgi:hypothetical protein
LGACAAGGLQAALVSFGAGFDALAWPGRLGLAVTSFVDQLVEAVLGLLALVGEGTEGGGDLLGLVS